MRLPQLQNQDGFALVMAVGMLAMMSITGTTVMLYTTSNQRIADRSRSDETSFSLSEAAINDAMAVLSNPSNNALDPDLLPATEAAASSAQYEQGTAYWWGVLNRPSATWTIYGVGRYNATTPGSAGVRRMLTAKVPVTPTVTQPLNNPSWNYVMSTQVTGGTCDMTLSDGTNTGNPLTVSARLYVFGNLCIGTTSGGNATVTGGPLMVLGKTTIQEGSSSIGTSTASINEAHVKLGCRYLTQTLHNPCSQGAGGGTGTHDNVWASVIDSSPTVLTAPTANFAGWYENAIPGPSQNCTTFSGTPPTFDNNYPVRDNNVPVFDLTPSLSYTCRVGPGASTTLSTALTATATTVLVPLGTGFPTSTFRLRIDDELMQVIGGFGTSAWTVTRGVNGTTAAPHLVSQTVQWDTPPSGEISWNAVTRKLTVSGTIYIDGSAKIGNGLTNTYFGQATLYLSGTFMVVSGSKMCAVLSANDCAFSGWDPNLKLFTVVADGTGGQNPAGVSVWMSNAQWQGALFGTGKVRLEGTTKIDGPAVGSEVELGYNVSTGTALGDGLGTITTAPAGMPSNPTVYAQPNPPQLFAG